MKQKKNSNLPESCSPPSSKTDQQRLNEWKRKKASTSKVRYRKKGNKLSAYCTDQNLSDFQNGQLQRALLTAATGSASEEFSRLLFNQVVNGFFKEDGYDAEAIANAVQDALLALKPQDEIEGMLASRLLVLHNQQMEYLERAATGQTTAGVDMNISRAIKLGRLYNETLESLNKYRRKGQQKIIVQHVNVNRGGKAVVSGEFNQGDQEG